MLLLTSLLCCHYYSLCCLFLLAQDRPAWKHCVSSVHAQAGPRNPSEERVAILLHGAQLFVAFLTMQQHRRTLFCRAAGPVLIHTDICNTSHACRTNVCAWSTDNCAWRTGACVGRAMWPFKRADSEDDMKCSAICSFYHSTPSSLYVLLRGCRACFDTYRRL